MIKIPLRILVALLFLAIFASCIAFTSNTATLLEINGAIGPATQDYIERGIAFAEKSNA